MRIRRKGQRGWVLIDGLIGFVVLTFVLLALASALRQSVISSAEGSNRMKAAYYAQQQLSDLRRYDHTGLDSSATNWATSQFFTDPSTGSTLQFTVVTAPVTQPDGLESDVIPVQATVTWTGMVGQPLTIVTYYYKQWDGEAYAHDK